MWTGRVSAQHKDIFRQTTGGRVDGHAATVPEGVIAAETSLLLRQTVLLRGGGGNDRRSGSLG